MNVEQLEAWYEEWSKSNDLDPVESSDNYYWAGAGSFKDFLRTKLRSTLAAEVCECNPDEEQVCRDLPEARPSYCRLRATLPK